MIAAIGGLFALKGWISIGSIVVFAEYSRQFTRPLNDLANQFNTMLSAIAGAERVFDVLDEKEEREDERTPCISRSKQAVLNSGMCPSVTMKAADTEEFTVYSACWTVHRVCRTDGSGENNCHQPARPFLRA